MAGLYDRIKAAETKQGTSTTAVAPSASSSSSGSIYDRIASALNAKASPISRALAGFNPASTEIAESTPREEPGPSFLDTLVQGGQAVARQWASTGSAIASRTSSEPSLYDRIKAKLAGQPAPKGEPVSKSLDAEIDPEQFFNVGGGNNNFLSQALGETVFGKNSKFSAKSEDRDFITSLGLDPDASDKYAGGSLTVLLSALDVTGAGEAIESASAATKAVRAAKTVEEAVKVGKRIGLSEQIAQKYAPLFQRAATKVDAESVLRKAALEQVATEGGKRGGIYERIAGAVKKTEPAQPTLALPAAKVPDAAAPVPVKIPEMTQYAADASARRSAEEAAKPAVLPKAPEEAAPQVIPERKSIRTSQQGEKIVSDASKHADMRTEKEVLEDTLSDHPGKELSNLYKGTFKSPDDVELDELINQTKGKGTDTRIDEIMGNPGGDVREAQAKLDEYRSMRARLTELKQGVRETRPAARVNRKLEEMAVAAPTFERFFNRSGITMEALDATARSKGYRNAESFYKDVRENPDKHVPVKKQEAPREVETERSGLYDRSRSSIRAEETGLQKELRDIEREPVKVKDEKGKEVEEWRPKRKLTEAEQDRADTIRARLKTLTSRRRDIDVIVNEARTTVRQRQARVRAIQEVRDLSDKDMRKVLGGRDIRTMTNLEFEDYMRAVEQHAASLAKTKDARIALEHLIQQKEFKDWENVLRAQKMPDKLADLSDADIKFLDMVFSGYRDGDKFLSTRQLETVGNSELKGMRTEREVLDYLAKKSGKTPEEIRQMKADIEARTPWMKTWPLTWKYDTMLARVNPLFDLLVHFKNMSVIKAEENIFHLEEKSDSLLKKARDAKPDLATLKGRRELAEQFETAAKKSEDNYATAEKSGADNAKDLGIEATAARKQAKDFSRIAKGRTFADWLVPTDRMIKAYMEAGPVERLRFAAAMTPEELAAARFQDDFYHAFYEDRVARANGKRFSQYENQYFPHIGRNFLEAWREDGVIKAFGEAFSQFKQVEKQLTILDAKTNQILPYEKWVGFMQKRSGVIVPSSNAARAFNTYVRSMEFARHFDSFIPEIMSYVRVLESGAETARGLKKDESLEQFVKEYVNAQKGRVPEAVKGMKPGGKMDTGLRTLVAISRAHDLGFNFATQAVTPIGETMANLTMLGVKDAAVGAARRRLKQGVRIVKKYKSFTGYGAIDKLFTHQKADANALDAFGQLMFPFYASAQARANEVFLLAKMTPEEFKAGTISTERLARLRNEMGEYREVEGSHSVIGRTSAAKAFMQYKGWAGVILSSTVHNAKTLVTKLGKEGPKALASKEGKQLFYSVVLGAGIYVGFKESYDNLSNKKNRTFLETLAFNGLRDMLSLAPVSGGALDAGQWIAVPRSLDYAKNLATAVYDMATFEKDAKGNLKGPKEIGAAVTPKVVSQFLPAAGSKKSKPIGNVPKLPALPTLPKVKTPALPKLPALPTL